MQQSSVWKRGQRRLTIAVAAVLLALLASVLVTPSARAMSDTGDGGVFVPTTGRILDTANNIGYSTPMTGGEWRTITVAGLAGVPADGSVGAISVIATVADMPGQGQLVGRPNAQTPSTLIMVYGGGGLGTTSNSAILAMNSNGTIQVQTETKARLLLDVQGYYTSNKDGTAEGGLVTVPGARIADTRSGLGVAKAQLKPGDTTTVQVTGTAGVPKGASAVVVNLIAINTSTANGFITPYATGTTRPKNALNYGSGNVPTSITAQVPLSSDGKMSVYNQSSTADLVVDVQAYFTAAGSTGAVFTPGTGRLYDSRSGSNTIVGNGETRSIQVAGGHTPVPGSGLTAVVITLTALHAANSSGGALIWAEGSPRPNTTSINFTPNSIRSNTITVPVSASGKVSLNNVGDPTHYVIDVQGWYVDPVAPKIQCPNAFANGSWSTTLPAGPVSCIVTAAPATETGQQLTLTIDGVDRVPVALSQTSSTSSLISVPAQAGWHDIWAFVDGGSGQGSYSQYSFGLADSTPSPVLQAIQKIAPFSLANLAEVSATSGSSSVAAAATADGTTVSLPSSASGLVTLTQEATADAPASSLATGLPFASTAARAQTESDGIVSYDNGNGTTTVPLMKRDGSVQITTVIASSSAPRAFIYPVALPAGGSMTLNDDGSVSVLNSTGDAVGFVDAPWAASSSGQAIVSHFEVVGSQLTQLIDGDLPSNAFPIVADPKVTFVANGPQGTGFYLNLLGGEMKAVAAGVALVGVASAAALCTASKLPVPIAKVAKVACFFGGSKSVWAVLKWISGLSQSSFSSITCYRSRVFSGRNYPFVATSRSNCS